MKIELENGEEILKQTGQVQLNEKKKIPGRITLTNNRVLYGEKEVRLGRIDTASIEYKTDGRTISMVLGILGLLGSTLLIPSVPNPMEHPVKLILGVLGVCLMYVSYHVFIGKTELTINGAVICTGKGHHKTLTFIAAEINRIKKRGVGKPMRSL